MWNHLSPNLQLFLLMILFACIGMEFASLKCSKVFIKENKWIPKQKIIQIIQIFLRPCHPTPLHSQSPEENSMNFSVSFLFFLQFSYLLFMTCILLLKCNNVDDQQLWKNHISSSQIAFNSVFLFWHLGISSAFNKRWHYAYWFITFSFHLKCIQVSLFRFTHMIPLHRHTIVYLTIT